MVAVFVTLSSAKGLGTDMSIVADVVVVLMVERLTG
jgi:hypothetical protein